MYDTFSSRLSELRELHQKSLEEVAKEINVSRVSLGNYEKGKTQPDVETLKRLSEYYNVTADYLVGRSPYPVANMNMEKMCDYTGLCQWALKSLHTTKDNGVAQVLNVLLSNDMTIDFINFCNDIITCGAFSSVMTHREKVLKKCDMEDKSKGNVNRIKYLLDSYHEANDKRNEYENKAKQFTQKLIDYYYNADANQPSKGYIIGQRIYNNLEKAQNNLNSEDGMLFSVLDIKLYDLDGIDVDDSEEKQ